MNNLAWSCSRAQQQGGEGGGGALPLPLPLPASWWSEWCCASSPRLDTQDPALTLQSLRALARLRQVRGAGGWEGPGPRGCGGW